MTFDTCPYCNADLRTASGRREIGHEIQGVYDGVLYWMCPDCSYAWPRFTDTKASGKGLVTEAAVYAYHHNVAVARAKLAEERTGEKGGLSA